MHIQEKDKQYKICDAYARDLTQLNFKKNRWQAELATLSQKGGNLVTQT